MSRLAFVPRRGAVVMLGFLVAACGSGDARESESVTHASAPTGITTLTSTGSQTGETESGSETDGASETTGTGTDSDSDSSSTSPFTTSGSDSDSDSDSSSSSESSESETGFGCGEGGDYGCDKVDFLFVIDNSGSMSDNQDNLIASFPGFISTIQNTLPDNDYRIMVVDTDAGKGPDMQLCINQCNNNPGLETCWLFGYPCNPLPDACDETLGAGVVYPIGGDASNVYCDIYGGNRYLLHDDPNIAESFACIAKVGDDGDGSERPAEAMIQALSFQQNQPGACNEGFLRDDALLVVTIITDEPDKNSQGIPAGWAANVIAAKEGDQKRVVVLGLFTDPQQPNPVCSEEHAPAPLLREFAGSFTNSIVASVCEPNYSSFFAQAVGLIDNACCEFEPPQ
ncbi:MAG: hypothetical protein ACPG4T_13295 [Nannocystaceae bacterium]